MAQQLKPCVRTRVQIWKNPCKCLSGSSDPPVILASGGTDGISRASWLTRLAILTTLG